ncbi:hypothetical protein IQ06DRAFT_55257 [Phaeosphaeriaceae sp. SRC1lsM3a]|nr:hypothetical protein IQ06DRAFT_55257 [Stagonospora sp. SRC1lsM3a]
MRSATSVWSLNPVAHASWRESVRATGIDPCTSPMYPCNLFGISNRSCGGRKSSLDVLATTKIVTAYTRLFRSSSRLRLLTCTLCLAMAMLFGLFYSRVYA